MGGPFSPLIDTGDGWISRAISDLKSQVSDLIAATGRIVASTAVQYDLNNTTLNTSFAEVVAARQTVVVPAGYTRAQVLLFVSAGATMNGQGNIGVQPRLTRIATSSGAAISNGTPGAGSVSVSAFNAYNLVNLDQDGSFVLGVAAYAASSTSVVAGSGNVHLSAVVTFLR